MAINNLPSYTVNRISIGGARLYIGATGSTPSTDIGAVERGGGEIVLARTISDVFQGDPGMLIKRYATQEMMSVNIQAMEWNATNFNRLLGAGRLSGNKLGFGGTPDTDAYAIRVKHSAPSGATVDVKIWQAVGKGNLNMAFNADKNHSFPFGWDAIYSATKWGGGTLNNDEHYGEIVYTLPPS